MFKENSPFRAPVSMAPADAAVQMPPMAPSVLLDPAHPQTLHQAIEMAMVKIDDVWLSSPLKWEHPPYPHTRSLLVLLSEYYSCHICSSKDIARKLSGDQSFPWPSASNWPTAQDIQSVRNQNKEVLKIGLIAALSFSGKRYFLHESRELSALKFSAVANSLIAKSISIDNQENGIPGDEKQTTL